MIQRVLGIDLASSRWASVGSATIAFDDERRSFTEVDAGAIAWPAEPLTPHALADAIDAFARHEGIGAIAMDGPQGWRDPATPAGLPGVGRRCEYECRTQGKTGEYPRTFPGTQRRWIEFCVDVFAELLRRPDVALADPAAPPPDGTRYVLLECFPTSAWRSSGLVPLPAKSKKPDLRPYWRALRETYRLPRAGVATHDDLQAVVAALAATAAVGGPAHALARGAPAMLLAHRDGAPLRIEGHIWDVSPPAAGALSAGEVFHSWAAPPPWTARFPSRRRSSNARTARREPR
jgi:hypothetical protein